MTFSEILLYGNLERENTFSFLAWARSSSMAQYKGAASEGARAMNLMKKREQQRQELEKMKQKIAEVRL